MIDPIDLKKNSFSLPSGDNSIIYAFDLAATSYLNFHSISKDSINNKIEKSNLNDINEEIHNKIEKENKKDQNNKINSKKKEINKLKNQKEIIPSVVNSKLDEEFATYPPPFPLESDPIRLKMLHSWYWAGYYTGYEDCKNQKK